ncbi:uncharacterized protein LOC127281495 [Leptopilina boulardi]|uniref:uncharacterized protein LOC127281495 n=1 Tax=Leptopilina boulardi TaxID=63433 RepID=UPI0021F59123|nr:uncharacterized protein LOC127281495 [Leptopilina boulardi]
MSCGSLSKILRGNKAELISKIIERDPDGSGLKHWFQKVAAERSIQEENQSREAQLENESLLAQLEAARKEVENMKNSLHRKRVQEHEDELKKVRTERERLARELQSAIEELSNLRNNPDAVSTVGSEPNSDILDLERRERDAEREKMGGDP